MSILNNACLSLSYFIQPVVRTGTWLTQAVDRLFRIVPMYPQANKRHKAYLSQDELHVMSVSDEKNEISFELIITPIVQRSLSICISNSTEQHFYVVSTEKKACLVCIELLINNESNDYFFFAKHVKKNEPLLK